MRMDNGHSQGDIKEWVMEEKGRKFNWSNSIVGSSRAIGYIFPYQGQYDIKLNESCVECFGKLDSGNGTEEDITIIKNCSNTFLPNITDHCNEQLLSEEDYKEFWGSAKKCFYHYVEEKDVDGKVQNDVKELMKLAKGVKNDNPNPGSAAKKISLEIPQIWNQEPELYLRYFFQRKENE